MPLGKNATAGDYVKDFRKSKAPQFKGKSKEKRHKMAIAAYLDKRDSQKEAKLAGNNLKLFSQLNRNGTKPELDRNIPELSMRLKAKAKIARGLRGPSTKARPDWMRDTGKRAKEIAKRARGHTALAKRDDTKKQLAKRALGITSEGMRGSTDAPKGPESYEAQYKRRLVKTTDPEHKEKGYNYRIKGKKNSALTKKLYKKKPDQGEFNKQMKRIAGHEFG